MTTQQLFTSPRMSETLRDYIAASRWFRAKTKTIAKVGVDDVFALGDDLILVVEISYTEGERDWYIVPATAASNSEAIARTEELTLYNALTGAAFGGRLLNAIACSETVAGRAAELVASHTPALDHDCGAPAPESFVSRAEQSNTSIIFRDRYILKLFRKLEQGVNPDVEIGTFLTARGFRNTPAVLGNIEYRRKNKTHAVAILQQFVPNQGDAWTYTLDSLGAFFGRALASGSEPPRLPSQHALELINTPIPDALSALIGDYLDSARLLGKRTAEMHRALADPEGGTDFAPEPFSAAGREQLQRDLLAQSDIAFETLRRKQAVLSGPNAESARRLLHLEQHVAERLNAVRDHPIDALSIRHHGDYHLGQVLYTGSDFMIIDFEGEPARPLAARRAKALALRDVAGMVRSFQYAAFAVLFGQVPGFSVQPETRSQVEAWAAVWNAYVSAAFLKAYFETAQSQSFLSPNPAEQRLLLDAFLLQKALYELAYELNNRPDWLQIPLQGILSLLG